MIKLRYTVSWWFQNRTKLRSWIITLATEALISSHTMRQNTYTNKRVFENHIKNKMIKLSWDWMYFSQFDRRLYTKWKTLIILKYLSSLVRRWTYCSVSILFGEHTVHSLWLVDRYQSFLPSFHNSWSFDSEWWENSE